MDKGFASKKAKISTNSNLNNFSNQINLNFQIIKNRFRPSQSTSNNIVKPKAFNITNPYSQKRRIHVNCDSSDASPIKSPLKKHRKAIENESSNSNGSSVVLPIPISWETANTSVDCKLKIKHDPANNQAKSQDTSHSFKKNGDILDKLLNECFDKLQFNDKDSGIEERKELANEFDAMLDDSWAVKENELNELERKIIFKESSKESGVDSCNSLEFDKQNVSPVIYGSQDKDLKKTNFKIPETPAKSSIKTNSAASSVQFNSTPKVVSRQSNKLNHSLNFEDISPIKGNDNCLVNIRQEGKRPLNESIDQEMTSSKKRNTGKILFRPSNDQQFDNEKIDLQINKQQVIDQNNKLSQKDQHKNEDDFGDDLDSFETILSQLDDKALISNCKQLKQSTNNDQLYKQNHQKKTQPFKFNQQKIATPITNYHPRLLPNKQKIYPKTQPAYQPNKNSIYSNHSCTPPSSQQTTRSTTSSLQFEFESSSLYNLESCKKSNANNLNDKLNMPNQRDLFRSQAKKEIVKQENNNEIYLMDEDTADMICQTPHF